MDRAVTTLLLALSLVVTPIDECTAEPQSLVNLRGNDLGGYGGPQFKATVLNGRFALYGGGPIMVILKPSWAIRLSCRE